ncbi:MAG: 3-phosphoglycerate dehydrogenase family protein [Pseudomonadota bacterium]|nr:3-phosphoglycerate dehydrogenase family protein [Pseudomonadota bacterium]
MKRIQILNSISPIGLAHLSEDSYQVASDIDNPDAILVRSASVHEMAVAENLIAVGRAGAGVNNIPIERLSEQGVAVFNAPGANANAVKELVMGAMFMAARNMFAAADYVREIQQSETELRKSIEAGKKQFAGFELTGRKLGVVGLGAIGVQVANAAVALGMDVYGYDPVISVHNAWHLNAQVHQCLTFDELVKQCDFITFHVPLIDATRNMLDAEYIPQLKNGAIVMNFSREGVIDEAAMLNALDQEHVKLYVTDFPTQENKNHPKVLALPHLGASTQEAEDQSATQVIKQLTDFIEYGIVVNSVNLPEVKIPPKTATAKRLVIVNANKSGMLAKITEMIGKYELNIQDLINKSRNDLAYTLVDVEGELPAEMLQTLQQEEGILSMRLCGS